MPTQLPVPILFDLPDGWRPVSPERAGAPGTAFVAAYTRPDGAFTANITVDGEYRPDTATLADLAQESVEQVLGSASAVEVTARQEAGPVESPSLTQTLAVSMPGGDELVQTQVYLSMVDVVDARKRYVVRLVLTATARQHPAVLGDFRDFVGTVRPGS